MTSQQRPNFLIILADDLGYSDVGAFGSEIPTPNIDQLAASGIRFSDYHVAAACSPTRSMLMSGTDAHIAGLGVMYEHKTLDPERWNIPGHEGYLNLDVAALPELLEDAGYWNVMSGKWHLGFRDEFLPSARGFHKSWALLPGCSNHFGWEPAYYGNDIKFPRVIGHQPPLYVEDGVKIQPTPNVDNSSEGFYSSDSYARNLVNYLEARDPKQKEQPFFAYLPFSAPHWPLQCLPEDRDRFKGLYDDGPAVLREKRLKRLIELGLVKPNVKAHDVVAKTPDWDEMSAKEKEMSARAMEVYAGMVHAMDRAIGNVIDYLKRTDQFDNTLIIFQSDNGAEGAALEAIPTMGTRLLDTIDKYYDNSYDNLGNHDSFIWYGPRWAQASTAPNRLMKAFPTEGGIRVPMILHYPPFNKNLGAGSICHAFSTCMDIVPTLLQLANGSHPNASPTNARDRTEYRDRQVFGLRGKSWVPYLANSVRADGKSPNDDNSDDTCALHGEDDAPVGWEQLGLASLRHGKWKIVFIPIGRPTGKNKWELFDLSVDQGETDDLSDQYPDKLKEMVALWDIYQEETGTVFGPAVKGPPRTPLLPDQIGGDPVEDQRIWMSLGVGARFTEKQVAPVT